MTCCSLATKTAFGLPAAGPKETEMQHTVDEGTRDRLLEASRDSIYCTQYLRNHRFGEYQAFKKYYVVQHGLRAKVALAEVELDLSRWEDARKSLAESEATLSGLKKYIQSKCLIVAKTEHLEKRLKVGWDRLKSNQYRSDLAAKGNVAH